MDEETTKQTKDELLKELLAITKNWNVRDYVPASQQNQCRTIGEKLNDIGGMSLMQDVYHEVHAHNRCASVVQAYWDGIGMWRW